MAKSSGSIQNTVFILLAFLFVSCANEKAAEEIIRDKLDLQEQCWNAGDIDCFMVGYWESDSLLFLGSDGPIYGYEGAKQRYYTKYPNKIAMGELKFTIIQTTQISPEVYQVVGKFHLTREIGNADGYFSLIWKLIDGEWVIISDHTS